MVKYKNIRNSGQINVNTTIWSITINISSIHPHQSLWFFYREKWINSDIYIYIFNFKEKWKLIHAN